jgi:hypothetical protein
MEKNEAKSFLLINVSSRSLCDMWKLADAASLSNFLNKGTVSDIDCLISEIT